METLRYVVLHHTGINSPHFDLLFEWEHGEPLTSFRCPTWPPTLGDRFEERPDHRAVYLTLEGPLTGNRGSVRRVDEGSIVHEVVAGNPPTIALTLNERVKLMLSNTIEPGEASFTIWTVVATS